MKKNNDFEVTNGSKFNQQLYISLIGSYLLVVAMGFGRFLYTATLPDIINQLSIDAKIAGYIATTNYIGYFFGALLAMLVPKNSTLKILIVGVVLSLITTLLIALPKLSLLSWHVTRFFSGIASSLVLILGSTFVLSFFSKENRLLLTTIHFMGVGVGIFLSAIITLYFESHRHHYTSIWGFAGVISFPVLLLLLNWSISISKYQDTSIPSAPSPIHNSANNFSLNIINFFLRKENRVSVWLIFSYGLAGFGYITSATFLPVIAKTSMPSLAYSGLWVWLLVGVCTIVSNPLWGKIARRFNELTVLAFLFIIQSLGMYAPILLDNKIGIYINAIVLGSTFMAMVSLTTAILKERNSDHANALVGLATLLYSVGQLIGPSVTALLAGEHDNFNLGFIAAGGALFMGFSIIVCLLFQEQQHD